jgi:hypothetical protein
MKYLMPVISFLIIMVSCSSGKHGHTVVSGVMTDAARQKVVLSELGTGASKALDSADVDALGRFEFHLEPKASGLYLLGFRNKTQLVLEIKPGDSVKITGSISSFPASAEISGSQNSRELLEFLRITSANKKTIDSLRLVLERRSGEPGFAELSKLIDQGAQSVFRKQWETQLMFIDTHFTSLTSLIALNQVLAATPVMTFERDSIIFIKLDSALGKSFPGNPHVDFHHNRILKAREQGKTERKPG